MKTIEVTIPVLNEEERLEDGVDRSFAFLNQNNLTHWRVVIADNGSTDATQRLSLALCERYSERLQYLCLDERGVGIALRASWSQSSADIVGYMDVDLATDVAHLLEVDALFQSGESRIVNGSRLLPDSRVADRTLLREITSRGLNVVLKYWLGVGFTDAMCGFKFLERPIALQLLDRTPKMRDWFLSAEMLVKAEWAGVPIREIAVNWQDDPRSKARVGDLARQYLGHIQRLRREKRAWQWQIP